MIYVQGCEMVKFFANRVHRRNTDPPKLSAPQTAQPVMTHEPHAPDQQPHEVVQLQGIVGNRAVQRGVGRPASTVRRPTGTIQRLMTRDEMIAKAGAPQKDKFFGLKKMSEKYKSILEGLQSYDSRLSVAVEVAGPRFAEGLEEMLYDMEKDCTAYIDAHKDDPRSAYIAKLRDEDIPKEREVLHVMTSNQALREKFGGLSMREALKLGRDQKALDDALRTLDTPSPSQTKKDEVKQAYTDFLGTDNWGLTGTINDEVKSSGTQPFRGNADSLTAQGKIVTETLGKDYVKDTIMPFMGELLAQAIGPQILTSAGALTSPDHASPEELAQVPATVNLINQLYGQLVQGLLVNSRGGIAVPQDILEAAAQTFARVYDTVEQDPKAEHGALHSARVSVVNMIFLRFINPTLMKVASQLPSGTSVQFIALRLSQIFQAQANGLDLVAKFPEMSESQDLAASTGTVISNVIDTVIQNGLAKALVLKQARQQLRTRPRGRVVLGSRPTK